MGESRKIASDSLQLNVLVHDETDGDDWALVLICCYFLYRRKYRVDRVLEKVLNLRPGFKKRAADPAVVSFLESYKHHVDIHTNASRKMKFVKNKVANTLK